MIFPSRAASNVVAGVILAMIACVVFAATMMSWRDWGYLLLVSALFTALVYFRNWTRWFSGFRAKAAKEAMAAKDRDDVVYICPVCRCAHHRPNEFCSCGCCHTSPPSREPLRPLALSLYESGALTNGRAPHHQQKHKL